MRKAQEAGGTFMALFNPESLPNRFPVLVWWLCLELIGLIVLPIGFVVFGNLRDRGYRIQQDGWSSARCLPALAGWQPASSPLWPGQHRPEHDHHGTAVIPDHAPA